LKLTERLKELSNVTACEEACKLFEVQSVKSQEIFSEPINFNMCPLAIQ
jgi:hypothetical protein